MIPGTNPARGSRIDPASITDAELRAHYALTGLARLGIPYERAIGSDGIRIALAGAAKAARRADMRRALAQPTQYPTQEAA